MAGPCAAPRRAASSLLVPLLLATAGAGCERGGGERDGGQLQYARAELGAAFIGGQAQGLRRFLHPDLIVQPPEPDTAVRQEAAAAYIVRLAQDTRVRYSELVPQTIAKEGEFLLERGTWFLESDGRRYRSRYTIRWRPDGAGWQALLWRWTTFR